MIWRCETNPSPLRDLVRPSFLDLSAPRVIRAQAVPLLATPYRKRTSNEIIKWFPLAGRLTSPPPTQTSANYRHSNGRVHAGGRQLRRSLGGTARRWGSGDEDGRTDEEDDQVLRGTNERDARPDGQLASLFRLQPTPGDMCGNKTRLRTHVTRIHLYLICTEEENDDEEERIVIFPVFFNEDFTDGIYPLEFSL